MARRFKCELITWGRTYSLARGVSLKILRDEFQPDFVIAIGRGGYVPARVVCDFLEMGALTAIKIEHWAMGARRREEARLLFPLNVDISGKKVLVVDDVTDTGETLLEASTHLAKHDPAEVRTAVLHHKVSARFQPDYFTRKVVKWRWIIYPWAVVEDITGFIRQMDPSPDTLEDVARRLYEDYELRLARGLLEDIWLLHLGRVPS